MPYNSETSEYERRSTTAIDATPDGDTVAVAIDVKLDTAADDAVLDLNHHKTNGNHYPATSTHTDSRFLKQSPAGVVSWADGVVAADAALKDFSNVASGAIAPEKLAWANFPRGRNLIINGDFRVNQRVYASGTNTTGANQYTLDRWRVVTSGQNITFTDYMSGRQITAPAGGIEQVVEGLNINGGTYVLNWEGNASASINGTARAKGESFTLPAKTNATVKFTGGTVARVQLESGSVYTPFEERHITDELALCYRYHERSTLYIWMQSNSYSTICAITWDFKVSKRGTPTLNWSVDVNTPGATINSTQVNTTSGCALAFNTTATQGGLKLSISADSEF